MARYRKKPVLIEAIRWDGENITEIFDFMAPEEPVYMDGFSNADDLIGIDTLEGRMVASKGDWIIKGVKGEFYPCKPEIFEATYEDDTEPHSGDERVIQAMGFAEHVRDERILNGDESNYPSKYDTAALVIEGWMGSDLFYHWVEKEWDSYKAALDALLNGQD